MSELQLENEDTPTSERWRRSREEGGRADRFDPTTSPLSHPGNEVERILREYACECYAVGRGESMYYLVEDLPRLAREATREILELKASDPVGPPPSPRQPEARRKKSDYSNTALKIGGGLKSLLAILTILAILAVFGIALGETVKTSIAGLVGSF